MDIARGLKLAWEYQGQQHYEFVPHFHDDAKHFKRRLQDDQLKRAKCRDESVTLIEVPYTVPLRGLEKWLREELERSGVRPVREEPVPISILNAYRHDHLTAMRIIAQTRGGAFLSAEYLGNGHKHLWTCRMGHEWEARRRDNKHSKSWCPTCGAARRGRKRRLGIEEMRALGRKHGGECLSRIYVNSQTKLRWQCARGHVWEAVPNNIKYNGAWCPRCRRKALISIRDEAGPRTIPRDASSAGSRSFFALHRGITIDG